MPYKDYRTIKNLWPTYFCSPTTDSFCCLLVVSNTDAGPSNTVQKQHGPKKITDPKHNTVKKKKAHANG